MKQMSLNHFALTSKVIKGLEKRTFVTQQELMNLPLMLENYTGENTSQVKQLHLHETFENIAKQNDYPVASASSIPDVLLEYPKYKMKRSTTKQTVIFMLNFHTFLIKSIKIPLETLTIQHSL
ncbi:Hypothetical predicted protein [Octopus vulgaris]|uniref:Uncharacterized protein n=1 Tax=Octopus vulgaris TaxID=6645 RepID=A0AA36F079_OCTVU|nr:Hypothetical predicted protein [Octopus vulgaris]